MFLRIEDLSNKRKQKKTKYWNSNSNILVFTLIPKNLCAIILSTIYLSPKNLGMKFELIWATENLGTNSSKNERFSTEPSVVYLPQIIVFSYHFSNFYVK